MKEKAIPHADSESSTAGFVKLLETFGDDSTIVRSARVSYAKGTKSKRRDTQLLRFLLRHRHTTPFEMCVARFHIRCPIFVARQWMRHRTGSFNEISARYSEMPSAFHVPMKDDFRRVPAPGENRQGSGECLPESEGVELQDSFHRHHRDSHNLYQELLERGVAREQARAVLPQSMMTEFLWMVNLHNLLHFLELRCGQDAQKEIREYATSILTMLESWVPDTVQAFRDYRLDSVSLTAPERKILALRLQGDPDWRQTLLETLSEGEQREFLTKVPDLEEFENEDQDQAQARDPGSPPQ